MRVIALTQAYNEQALISRYLQHLYEFVDLWIISEGSLAPGLQVNERSSDCTRKLIESFALQHDPLKKITVVNTVSPIKCYSREMVEGMNKNRMLSLAEPEDGDLIFIGDVDEFWHREQLMDIFYMFKKNDKLEHVPIEEYQFAYNMRLCFNASHDGRFMRYRKMARFSTTNHFIYPDGRDVTRDYSHLVKREFSGMCHLCWVKDPWLVRQKVLSFGRPSFTRWYNEVYLQWLLNPEDAYQNNSRIPPYHGTGFAEGQHERLREIGVVLPAILKDISDVDWSRTVIDQREQLRI